MPASIIYRDLRPIRDQALVLDLVQMQRELEKLAVVHGRLEAMGRFRDAEKLPDTHKP